MAEIQVTVTIENLAPEAGTFVTPFWVGFHNGQFDSYNRGEAISPAFERLVEDGNNELFSQEFLDSGNGLVDGTIAGLEGIEGPIDPGETVTATFTIDDEADTSQFFSYASMIIPSNDAFVANGDPEAHSLFDEDGNFIGADFTILGSEVLDGGTEVNDELAESTAFFSQAEADTGTVENGVVTEHPGFIEGGRILSEDGTSDGAPAAFTGADFTADGYEVARVTVALAEEEEIEVGDPVTITSTLDGEQEVDGGDPDASGTSTLTLNDLGDSLEYSLTVFGLDFGANGLLEGGAQTDDTSDDVTRLHIHNASRGENGDVVFSLFDTVAPELGDVLDIPGNQDEDLEVTANEDGSVTLTGVWEESDPANTALSSFVSDIRDTEVGEDLDFYWNIHTEEFPGGAIRGQLEVAEEAVEVEPIEVTVTIENLAPEAGTFLTPFWVGFHNGQFDSYNRGEAISPVFERLVEDGNNEPFSQEFLDSGNGLVDGTIAGLEGIEGPIDPGETVTATFTIDPNADTSQFFSYASMIIPSNDAFVANGDPEAHSLFDEDGNFIGADFTILGSEVLDGGTEVNDELAESTAFFSQAEADTGTVENGVVTEHPGFIEGGRILSEDGTSDGAPAAFTGADFTADGYEVARVTVALAEEVEDPETINLFRFRNTTFDTGTYVFVGEEERDAILADENLSNSFSLDGVGEDGAVNPAFTASTVSGEDLIPFFRLSSLATPGTFLFVSTEEYDAIFAEGSDQADQWERQGFDGDGNDIAEFFLSDGSLGGGADFNRFQNNQNQTFLYAGPDESSAIAGDPNLSNLFNDQGFAFASLG